MICHNLRQEPNEQGVSCTHSHEEEARGRGALQFEEDQNNINNGEKTVKKETRKNKECKAVLGTSPDKNLYNTLRGAYSSAPDSTPDSALHNIQYSAPTPPTPIYSTPA